MSEVVGAVFAVAAGATVAYSMVVQRYALTYPEDRVPFIAKLPKLTCKLKRNYMWFIGLVIYGIGAGGFYSIAGLFISLSLLSALFATVLIFQLFFARWYLHEVITPPRVVGSIGVLLGTVLCVIGRADGVPTKYTPDEVRHFFQSPGGLTYLIILHLLVAAGVVCIILVERKYPVADLLEARQEATEVRFSRASSKNLVSKGMPRDTQAANASWSNVVAQAGVHDRSSSQPAPAASTSKEAPPPSHPQVDSSHVHVAAVSISRSSNSAAHNTDTKERASTIKKEPRLAPVWLDRLMSLVYPGSLGLDEAIAHLSLRAMNAMLAQCPDNNNCNDPILYFVITWWILSSIATLWWLRVVFKRYEVSRALPVEYGAATAADILSGIILFQEADYMSIGDIVLNIVGILVICSSIGLSLAQRVPLVNKLPRAVTRYCCCSLQEPKDTTVVLSED